MAAKKEKKQEKKEEAKEFVVSLSKVFKNPKPKRAYRAINFIKKFIFKHFRIKADDVSISNALNEAIWAKGREHIPRKIEIKVVKEDNKAKVYLKGEKIAQPKKKKKEEAKAEEKTEETKEEKAEIEKKKEDKKTKEKAAELTQIKRGGK